MKEYTPYRRFLAVFGFVNLFVWPVAIIFANHIIDVLTNCI